MLYLLLALVALLVALGAVLVLRRGPDVVARGRPVHPGPRDDDPWSQGGWSGPPRSPGEAGLGEPRRTEEPPRPAR